MNDVKKINSTGYAYKIIGLAFLFLVAVPIFCYLLSLIFQAALFITLIRISLGIGLLISIFFAGLLAIELRQDKKINRQYPKIKKQKLVLENGKYECQSCGNRQVSGDDKSCCICGTTFSI